ncbi:amino acid ABC transporter ATP-binding protein [Spirochaeta africana]|uniref:ABC-type polar amino acid transport system, ATPase component n=1 Tax=Spirochaeta africana (strain ATCC 700263 / DSM 8902 / Z-7692) TaxID=889378 RepID=H9UHE8_SPIAZ|nr:ATP-binding cassette domain-containing protein [Spirochaeta africana]AFG36941.1 ABC-type polar amino acid transport system, ATPase component [Spirochaeta africana DSM 8902]
MKIELKDLSHHYDIPVLHQLNLIVQQYKSIAIIGVSGSGKSTLLRILSGLEAATSGTAQVNGHDVAAPAYRASVGFVFQNHNLFPHLSLLRNITLVLEKTRGYTRQQAHERATRYLDLLHLGNQAHKLPRNVSGGQAQRASIARALSIEPEVIFLDEPTSSLDPVLTYEVLAAIKELRELGMEFVLVSHVMSFVHDFADYVIYMEDGSIAEHGPPTILDAPATRALQDFMAKVP